MSNALIITLAVLGYIVMWIIMGVWYYIETHENDAVFVGAFWPFSLPAKLISYCIKFIVNKIEKEQ